MKNIELTFIKPKYISVVKSIPFPGRFRKIKCFLYILGYPVFNMFESVVVARSYFWINKVWLNPKRIGRYEEKSVAKIIDHEYFHIFVYESGGKNATVSLDNITKIKERTKIRADISI